MRPSLLALASIATLAAACADGGTGPSQPDAAMGEPSFARSRHGAGTIRMDLDTLALAQVGDVGRVVTKAYSPAGAIVWARAMRLTSRDAAVAAVSGGRVTAMGVGTTWVVASFEHFQPDSVLVRVGGAAAPTPAPAPAPTTPDSAHAPTPAPTPTPAPAPGPAPSPAPTPTNPGGSHEPAGMMLISDRDFAAKSRGVGDRAGAQGWDPIEARYGNLSIVADPTAPFSASSVAQMKYPAGMQSGVAPGTAQIAFPGALRKRELYISTWVKLSSNFHGNVSNTNKMFFVWIGGGARFFVSAEGKGMGPLMPQLRLQGKHLPDARARLVPNVAPGVTLQRGVWQRWELRLVANTPGKSDGVIQWWLDGQLISDYRDVGFISPNESPAWEQFQWSPTYGGGGAGVPHDMYLWLDHVRIGTK